MHFLPIVKVHGELICLRTLALADIVYQGQFVNVRLPYENDVLVLGGYLLLFKLCCAAVAGDFLAVVVTTGLGDSGLRLHVVELGNSDPC